MTSQLDHGPQDLGALSGSREPSPGGLGPSGFDPARIADSLSPAERTALMHREGASEACMSWDIAHSLYDLGLTLRNARFLRLTWRGAKVRTALQEAIAIEAGTAATVKQGAVRSTKARAEGIAQ